MIRDAGRPAFKPPARSIIVMYGVALTGQSMVPMSDVARHADLSMFAVLQNIFDLPGGMYCRCDESARR